VCRETFLDGTGTESLPVSATYSGDANFTASSSTAQVVNVVGTPGPAGGASPPGGSAGPQAVGIGRAGFGAASVSATMADVVVTCKGAKGQRCTVTLKLSSREKTKRGKVVAATAAKATTRTVVLGTRTIALAAGLGEVAHVKLNAAARRLLARLHRLPVILSATQKTSKGSSAPSRRRLTFKSLRATA
jgi:hypothetical protein